jgi:hypothetical protein
MNGAKTDLQRRIETVEEEFESAFGEKEKAFRHDWSKGKARIALPVPLALTVIQNLQLRGTA